MPGFKGGCIVEDDGSTESFYYPFRFAFPSVDVNHRHVNNGDALGCLEFRTFHTEKDEEGHSAGRFERAAPTDVRVGSNKMKGLVTVAGERQSRRSNGKTSWVRVMREKGEVNRRLVLFYKHLWGLLEERLVDPSEMAELAESALGKEVVVSARRGVSGEVGGDSRALLRLYRDWREIQEDPLDTVVAMPLESVRVMWLLHGV